MKKILNSSNSARRSESLMRLSGGRKSPTTERKQKIKRPINGSVNNLLKSYKLMLDIERRLIIAWEGL